MDFGHAYLSSILFKREYMNDIDEMLQYAVHAHIHDNFGINGTIVKYMDNLYRGIGDLHLPPGWGNLPWNKISKSLKNLNGTFILETEFRFYPYFKEAVEFIKELII